MVAVAAGKRTFQDVVSFRALGFAFDRLHAYSTPKPASCATPAPHVVPSRFRLVAERYSFLPFNQPGYLRT
jgi:hypothetical protein